MEAASAAGRKELIIPDLNAWKVVHIRKTQRSSHLGDEPTYKISPTEFTLLHQFSFVLTQTHNSSWKLVNSKQRCGTSGGWGQIPCWGKAEIGLFLWLWISTSQIEVESSVTSSPGCCLLVWFGSNVKLLPALLGVVAASRSNPQVSYFKCNIQTRSSALTKIRLTCARTSEPELNLLTGLHAVKGVVEVFEDVFHQKTTWLPKTKHEFSGMLIPQFNNSPKRVAPACLLSPTLQLMVGPPAHMMVH